MRIIISAIVFCLFARAAFAQTLELTGKFVGGIEYYAGKEGDTDEHFPFVYTWEVKQSGNKFSGTAEMRPINSKGYYLAEIEGIIKGNELFFKEIKVIKQDSKPSLPQAYGKKNGKAVIFKTEKNYRIAGELTFIFDKGKKAKFEFDNISLNGDSTNAGTAENVPGKDIAPENGFLNESALDSHKGKDLLGKKLNFDKLVFDFNDTNLKNPEMLDKLAEFLKKNPDISILAEGHTDNVGEKEYNQKLSLKRAEAVKTCLIKKGVSPAKITVKGCGSEKQISEIAAQNRRVEIHFGK
jgi:outer membrane protein OmpA-like peptidoglycan-associated protein